MNKQKENLTIKNMAYISICTVLIVAGAWITIPIGPIPFTMQTFSIFITLLLLGGKKGTLAIVVYTLIGAVGLPVFSGGKGSLAALFGMTGGFIIGFIIMGLTYILLAPVYKNNLILKIVALILGLILCYVFGLTWFIHLYTKNVNSITVGQSMAKCITPFIIPDLAKLTLAVVIYKLLQKRIHININN